MAPRLEALGDDDSGSLHPVQIRTLVGHAHAEQTVLEAHRSGRLHHAWLIGGPEGIGKATFAWHVARMLLAWPDPASRDLVEATSLAPAADETLAQRLLAGGHSDLALLRRQWNDKTKKLFSDIRVDDVRDALGLFQRASASGGYRVCIIDSAEDLNRSSANALLKLIEEPPARSVFLIVTHRPGQVMPTLVSRCRRLMLSSLSVEHTVAAVRALGGRWATLDTSRLEEAARRSRGSVGETLRLAAGSALDLDEAIQASLRGLPQVDWIRVHRLADMVGMSDDLFELVLQGVLDWIGARLHDRAPIAPGPRALLPLAQAFEAIRAAAREALALNLDKRPVLLGIFADLARAARTA